MAQAPVGIESKRRSAWRRARRAPEMAISTLAFLLVVLLLAHRHVVPPLNESSLHALAEDAAMMAAMMLPLAGPSARSVAQRSLRSRWAQSVGEHVVGFSAVWFGYGIAAAVSVRLLSNVIDRLLLLSLLLILAAAWQVSADRRRRIERCGHLRTTPPTGWRADVGSTVVGGRQAVDCVTTCWASMLAMVATTNPIVMGTVLAANLSEWAPGPNAMGSARRRRPAAVYLILAAGALLLLVARPALSDT
ncbi:MAG TPA: DUF2182 domain-containing protein [Acidimicrobiales bacterium]|nr:DUF2182 domain-containing protein [Acidimicrobiales bacterium]